MEGEDGDSADDRAFTNKPVWARIAVVAAGPVFNFIMAFAFSVILMACIGYDKPVISGVMDGYPAQAAGMQEGDTIVKMNHKHIHFCREINLYLYFHPGETVDVTYERDGELKQVTLTPEYDEKNGGYYVGFYESNARTKANVGEALKYGVYYTKYWVDLTFESVKMLFTGKVGVQDMSGPVGIVKTIGDTYEESKTDGMFYVFVNMLNISILLSANLGVMNLLPIPALDGGRLVFLIIEAIRRKRIDPEKEGMVHFVGMMCLMALMVLIMFSDIRKLF